MPFRRRSEPYNVVELYEYAVGALGRRMRTVAELKRLLRQRVAGQPDGPVMVEAIIQKLKEQRYLNDSQYAADYSSLRRDNEGFGRRRVITDLKNKGVHGDIIEKTVSAAYDGVNEEKLARQYLARKRMTKPADQKQAAKIFRALLRAGFSSRTIVAILKQWEVDEEVIGVLESADIEWNDDRAQRRSDAKEHE